MKKETVIHIPERGCHNCRLHCVNHKKCDSEYPCKQGMEWRPIVHPIEPQEETPKHPTSWRDFTMTDKIEPKQTPEEFAKMKNGSFMQIGCIDEKMDLWGNINCQNHIDPATCKRETSCLICERYYPVKPKQTSTCVDCDKEKDTHSICAECLDKLIKQNQQPEISVTDEDVSEPIQNALYATNAFTTDQCSELADGILLYLKEAGFIIFKSKQP